MKARNIFSPQDPPNIFVRNASVKDWYCQMFELKAFAATAEFFDDINDASWTLGFDPHEPILFIVGQAEPSSDTPMLFVQDLSKAHEFLKAKGANPQAIENDRDGGRFFELRDPEGNVLTLSEY